MTSHRAVLVSLIVVCLGSLVWAQPADPPPVNWTAPPYWTPPVATEPELAAETADVAKIKRRLRPSPLPFVAITPCRVADTRSLNLGREYGAPALAPAESRTMTIAGQCDIPIDTVAVSFNFSVINMTGAGGLKVQPAGEPAPPEATTAWSPATGLTSLAAVLLLGAGGAITLINEGLSMVDVTLDINGYYAPPPQPAGVRSVFGRAGDVVAMPGDYSAGKVTNVPAGTISATDVQGAVNQLDTSKAALSHTHGATGIVGLTSGGVVFGSLTGTLGQNPSQLFWDQANDRLGIGTSSPGQQLELTGNLALPATTATTGQIRVGLLPFLHAKGSNNAFLGFNSGNFSMTGMNNTATGEGTLTRNTTGWSNTASGAFSLFENTTGMCDTAIGSGSLGQNRTGNYNTAIGTSALPYNDTGSHNIGIGFSAGLDFRTGSHNIYIANRGVAVEGNTIRIGDANQTRAFIAGIRGVTPDTLGVLPVVIDPNGQLGTLASGGTVVTSVFGRTGAVVAQVGDYTAAQITGLVAGGVVFGSAIGTLAQSPGQLFFDQINNKLGIGTTTPSEQLELTGNLALPATTATTGQFMLGGAPFIHGYGNWNTFLGHSAGNFSTTGIRNTATGFASLYLNTEGTGNTATGAYSLGSNTRGVYNTATGYMSLLSNTNGSENTASGQNSLFSNTEGSSNTAVGAASLQANTTGRDNTAIGDHSAGGNTTGADNTAIGANTLISNGTGSNNIAFGSGAGYYHNGSYNIHIGNRGTSDDWNMIRIGDEHQNRTFIAGIRGVTTGLSDAVPVLVDSAGQLGTISSSIRFKQHVADMGKASSRLLELRPVTFHYMSRPDGPLQYGLIAEEVEQVMPELVVRDATGQVETVAYHELPAMLLNELQKQHATIQAQQAQIEELRRIVQVLIREIDAGRTEKVNTD